MSVGGSDTVVIDGKQFLLNVRELDSHEVFDRNTWDGWVFVAYDREVNIYPASSCPAGIKVQETIVGASGISQEDARERLVEKLREVIKEKSLDATGFLSLPANKVWPQQFEGRSPKDL